MEQYNPWEGLSRVRKKKPVIHCINNFVSAPFVANTLLSAGATPVMAVNPMESAEITSCSDALVINTGTPSQNRFEAISNSVKEATESAIPWVLDPVAVGLSNFRLQSIRSLLKDFAPSVIRGNAAEISMLANSKNKYAAGISSELSGDEVEDQALSVADKYKCLVIASGATDIVSDNKQVIRIKNGDIMMTRISGTGCVSSAMTAAFLASESSYMRGAVHAMMVMGITGQLAGQRSQGPASFRSNFIDQLYNIDPTSLNQNVKAELKPE